MPNFSYSVLTQRLLFISLTLLLIFSLQTTWAEELAAPEFSHESGFYPEEFELHITHPNPSVKIYYTLDGSDPDPTNLNGTTFRYKNEYAQPPATEPIGEFLTQEYKTYAYDKPILIKDRTYEPDRISQISTTFDTKPSYFPKPERILKDNWLNKIKILSNKLITKANKALNKLVIYIKKYILNEKNIATRERKYLRNLKLEYETVINPKYLYKGTVVKAFAIDKNNSSSRVIIKTLFIGDQSKFMLPIINITVPEKNLFDYDDGVLVAGVDYDNWLESGIKAKKANGGSPANWKARGKNLQVVFSFLDEKEKQFTEHTVDMRIHGGYSRAARDKSFKIYPRKKYTNKGIEHPVFIDAKPVNFSRLILRNGGNGGFQHTHFADAATQRTMKGLNFAIQRYRPVTTFINGEYNGILNIRDKIDHHYLAANFNLPSHKLDSLKRNKIVERGSSKSWNELLSFIENSNKKSKAFASGLDARIDITSFIDYFSAQIFIANDDWPGNNIRYWRYNGSKKYPVTSMGYTDGRWRWAMYDIDALAKNKTVDGEKYNTLAYATENGHRRKKLDWAVFILSNFLENPELKLHFITRFSDLINSTFKPDRISAIIRDTEAGIENEMPRHINRWSAPKSMEYWRESVNDLVSFFEQRPAYQWQHLQEFFELDGFYSVQVDITEQGAGKVTLNTLTLGDDPSQEYDVTDTPLLFPWTGQYFQNLPLTLEALPEEGYAFSHWDVSGQQLTAEQKGQAKLILKPQSNLEIKAVMVRSH